MKRKIVKPIINIKFGTEHTFGSYVKGKEFNRLFVSGVFDKSELHYKILAFAEKVYYDSDCIEIPSKVYNFNEINDMERDYSIITTLLPKKYKPSSCYKNLENEGGGHIHLDLPTTNLKLFLQNIVKFSANYPELSWVFNNPFDNYNSRSILNNSNYSERYHYANDDNYTDKTQPIVFREEQETVEFRFFMMHRDMNEFKVHLNVATCIYNYMFKLSSEGKKIYLKYTDIDQFPESFQIAKNNILDLFKLIELPAADIKYIIKNKFCFMKQRFEHDKYYKKRELLC